MFDWEGFKRGEFVAQCKEKEDAEDFVEKCLKNGIQWRFPVDKGTTYWEEKREETCYHVDRAGLYTSPTHFFIIKGLEVIRYEKEEKDMPRIYFIPDGLSHAKCAHAPDLSLIDCEISEIQRVEPHIYDVVLRWSLQLDGTYRRLGKCPICGRMYATEEVR